MADLQNEQQEQEGQEKDSTIKNPFVWKLPGDIKVEELKNIPSQVKEQIEFVEGTPGEKGEQEDEYKEQYIAVLLGDREVAFRVKDVEGIIDMQKIIPVPGLPPYINGICNVRGEITSVVDLHAILGFKKKSPASTTLRRQKTTEKIAILKSTIYSVGFVVDSVLDVLRVAANEVIKVSSEDSELGRIVFCAEGLFVRSGEELGENEVVLIDTKKLLNLKELTQFQ
jgi:purine-binding chemotaxis protein CheW